MSATDPSLASLTPFVHACHSTAQHSTAQHSTAQHSTAQHSTYLIHIRGFVFLQSLSGAHPLTVLGCGVLPGCSSCLQHHHEPMFVYAVGPGSFLFDLRVDILGNRLVCGKIEHLNTITENILNVLTKNVFFVNFMLLPLLSY